VTKRSSGPSDIDRRAILRGAAAAATASVLAGIGAGAQPGAAHASASARAPVDLAGSVARWGSAEVTQAGAAIDQTAGALGLFPKLVRLPVAFPAAGTGWELHATVESTLVAGQRAERPDIEDFALSFADARVQLWFGGRRTPGLRLLVYGVTVAEAAAFAAPSGAANALSVAVAAEGSVTATGNGVALGPIAVVFADASLRDGGPVDLIARNGPARWSAIAGTGLLADPNPGAPWRRRPDEPDWDPREAIGYGYQPQPTHLWNRWSGQLLRTPADYPGLPPVAGTGASGAATAITHGPLLGMPAAGRLGIMVRTARPAQAQLLAGPGADPAGWRVLDTFATGAAAGNTGHATIGRDVFAAGADALNFTVAVDGALADWRVDGAWPVLRERWLTAAERATATLAVTHCDNVYPAVAPLLSPLWRERAADADLLLHLGDHVYEQGYRRRAAVSRLDHLEHFAPGTAQAWRGRLLPAIGLFDDHDIYNDVTGTGSVGRYADIRTTSGRDPDAPQLPPDMAWRIASRDIGRAVWEEWVGWGTPQDSRHVVLTGAGRVDGGVLTPDDFAPWAALDDDAVAALAPLAVWPESVPQKPWTIAPDCAGSYRVVGLDRVRGLVRLDPAPLGAAAVSFGVSTPRYGSLRLGNAELLLIDTRTARTFWTLDRDDPHAGMLGARQRAWLLGRIRASTASVLFVASSNTVSFANEVGANAINKRDSWTGYAFERGLILDALVARGGPAVFLTGDLHNTAVRRLNPHIHEIICGAWSNIGFCGIAGAARPVAGFPDAELLWAGPATSPDCDWATWSTIVETDRAGGVSLDVIDLAADRSVKTLRL
jgi:hypothetical protein